MNTRRVDAHPMTTWLFRDSERWNKSLRGSIGGVVLVALVSAVVKGGFEHLAPTSGANAAASLLIAAGLATLLIVTNFQSPLRLTAVALAVAYSSTLLLYFMTWLGYRPPSGYEVVTDAVGTVAFLFAWWLVAGQERPLDRNSDRALVLAVLLLLLAGSTMKGLVDARVLAGPDPHAESESARLLINLCNGAAFLGTYSSLRRLGTSANMFFHPLIVGCGCAQIAAHGVDCIRQSTACAELPDIRAVAATLVAWLLMAGNSSFAIYVVFSYLRLGRWIEWTDRNGDS